MKRRSVFGGALVLALLTGTLGKIARDLSLLMQTEVGEAFEPANWRVAAVIIVLLGLAGLIIGYMNFAR